MQTMAICGMVELMGRSTALAENAFQTATLEKIEGFGCRGETGAAGRRGGPLFGAATVGLIQERPVESLDGAHLRG